MSSHLIWASRDQAFKRLANRRGTSGSNPFSSPKPRVPGDRASREVLPVGQGGTFTPWVHVVFPATNTGAHAELENHASNGHREACAAICAKPHIACSVLEAHCKRGSRDTSLSGLSSKLESRGVVCAIRWLEEAAKFEHPSINEDSGYISAHDMHPSEYRHQWRRAPTTSSPLPRPIASRQANSSLLVRCTGEKAFRVWEQE